MFVVGVYLHSDLCFVPRRSWPKIAGWPYIEEASRVTHRCLFPLPYNGSGFCTRPDLVPAAVTDRSRLERWWPTEIIDAKRGAAPPKHVGSRLPEVRVARVPSPTVTRLEPVPRPQSSLRCHSSPAQALTSSRETDQNDTGRRVNMFIHAQAPSGIEAGRPVSYYQALT